MPRRTCIHCGSNLIPNPNQRHWSHCPVCDPLWANHVQEQHRINRMNQLVHTAVNDTRGRPSVGAAKP